MLWGIEPVGEGTRGLCNAVQCSLIKYENPKRQTFHVCEQRLRLPQSLIDRSVLSPALMSCSWTLKLLRVSELCVKCLGIPPPMWVFVSLADGSRGSVRRRSAALFMQTHPVSVNLSSKLPADAETEREKTLCHT